MFRRMGSAKIIGTGSYVPEKVLTNHDLEQMMDTTDEWIQTKYGIKERHIAADDQQISDLSVEAAKRALDQAGLQPEDIDLIVQASIHSDLLSPATACIVQGKLGATQAVAFDMNIGGCPNAVFALSTALNFLDGTRFKRALVICTEIYSRFIDWNYRYTACFLGDGSGAVVLEACPEGEGVLAYNIHTNGSQFDKAKWDHGGTPFIDGKAVWAFGHTEMPNVLVETVRDANMEIKDLDFVVFHQANVNIIHDVMKMFELPLDRTHINNDRYGNTGGASTMIALDEAVRFGKIKSGDRIALCSYGAGLAWGAMVIQY